MSKSRSTIRSRLEGFRVSLRFGSWFLGFLHFVPMLCLGKSPADVPKSDAAAREASLAAMRQRVESTRITVLGTDGAKSAGADARLVEAPIFRYSDELREIEDAGMWLWTDRGRPVAVMKVERYKASRFSTQWLYCFVSLSPELVRAEWRDSRPFQAKQPGVKWQDLNDKPAITRAARLVQLREMARRFSGEILVDKQGKNRLQMRLLSRPLYRFDESRDLLDGVVFGFTGAGTNPDALLLFDLAPNGGWRFSVAGITADGLRVKLDDRVIHEHPNLAGEQHVFDTWCYFRPAK